MKRRKAYPPSRYSPPSPDEYWKMLESCFEIAFDHPETLSRDAYEYICRLQYPIDTIQMCVLRDFVEETCVQNETTASLWSNLFSIWNIPFSYS